jgi:chromosome segregation ATPase
MYIEWRDISGNWCQAPLTPDMEPVTIGRNPGSTIYSKETTVSRNHGRIGYDADGYYIKDLGSSNGTFVNNERTQRSTIKEGDTVRCGEVLEIHLRPGSADNKAGAQAISERPVQKAMPTAGIKPEDQARLAAMVAEQQATQHAQKAGLSARGAPTLRAPIGTGGAGAAGGTGGSQPGIHARETTSREGNGQRSVARPSMSTEQGSVVQPPVASPGRPTPAATAAPGESAELQRKVRALEQALADAEARATRAENDLKALEPRAMRYSVELEGLSEKYVKLKEHNQVIQKELDKTRSDLRQREDEAFEAERKSSELEQQIQVAREKATDATEQLSGLKVRLTQKDRQIEELQRQLDLLEYELRAARDENESLQSSFNRESNDQGRLERKINLLQEVIQEKEDRIQQLQIELREKDLEIRQVRMGVGMSDLESEKRQLLQDYHNATRRVDELNDRILTQQRMMDGLRAEVDAQKAAAADRKPVVVDVSEHPDFKAKAREVERIREELSGVQKELARAQVKLEHVESASSQAKGLEVELNAERKKIEALESKLNDTEARLNTALTEVAAPKGPVVTPEVSETLEALADTVAASKSNATLVRRYAQQMEKHKSAAGDMAEAVELMNDIAIVLAQDLSEQERMVGMLQKNLSNNA